MDFKITNTSVVLNLKSQTAPSLIHAPALIYAFIKGGERPKNSIFIIMFPINLIKFSFQMIQWPTIKALREVCDYGLNKIALY